MGKNELFCGQREDELASWIASAWLKELRGRMKEADWEPYRAHYQEILQSLTAAVRERFVPRLLLREADELNNFAFLQWFYGDRNLAKALWEEAYLCEYGKRMRKEYRKLLDRLNAGKDPLPWFQWNDMREEDFYDRILIYDLPWDREE